MKKIIFFICFVCMQNALSQQSWTLVQAGGDIYNGQIDYEDWPNRWDIESLDMKPVQGGFLTCGYYNDQIFDSTDGNIYDLTGHYGAYLIKYNYSGEIQWLVRTEKSEDEERNVIMSIATDSQNNIYIIGSSDGIFYDADGESQIVAPQSPEGGSSPFLIKLDANGDFLWKTIISGCYAKRVAVDSADNVVVCGAFNTGGMPFMFFNDQYVGVLSDIPENSDANYYIAKYDSNGMPLWDNGIFIDSVNSGYLEGITFDQNNNIFINGMYEMALKVYDNNGADFIERDWSGNYGGSMFIAKYSEDGDAQWIVNSDDTTLTKIITNSDGSHYITGTNTVYNDSEGIHYMSNADGTIITQDQYGPFYFAKINSTGNWEWLTGSSGSIYGDAYEMFKYEDKISIVGRLSTPDVITLTGVIYDTNNNSVPLTIDTSDNFIVTYKLDGTLYSLGKSGDNADNNYSQPTSGFFRDDEGFFYIQRNLWFGMSAVSQDFYGQSVFPVVGTTDASITKFKESDGKILYLTVDEFDVSGVKLAPNPTTGAFSIHFGKIYSDIDLSIVDVTGKTYLNRSYANTDVISAEILGADGLYFIKVHANDSVRYFKLIKGE